MAEYTITEVEKTKDLPDWQEKGAKVFKLTIEGEDRQPELFVPNDQPPPQPGKIEGEISDGNYGPSFKKAGAFKGGKGRSEASDKRMNRASAQKQACQIVTVLGHVPDEATMRGLIQWFENDIYGKKSGTEIWPMNSDVPADTADLFDPVAEGSS